jgi:hypothetical protein
MKKYIKQLNMIKVLSLALMFIVGILLVQVYSDSVIIDNLQHSQSICDSLQTRVIQAENFADSIKSELFIVDTEVNRYRIALEMLEEENYAAASEFNKRLSMTE